MVYQNSKGFIEYSSKNSQYVLGIQGQEFSLQFCEFHNIHTKIKSIDIETILYNTDDKDDYTTFKFTKLNQSITLTVSELLVLKDLVEGIVFELYLEDILYRAGVCLPEEELVY
jgi:hypothetical protein